MKGMNGGRYATTNGEPNGQAAQQSPRFRQARASHARPLFSLPERSLARRFFMHSPRSFRAREECIESGRGLFFVSRDAGACREPPCVPGSFHRSRLRCGERTHREDPHTKTATSGCYYRIRPARLDGMRGDPSNLAVPVAGIAHAMKKTSGFDRRSNREDNQQCGRRERNASLGASIKPSTPNAFRAEQRTSDNEYPRNTSRHESGKKWRQRKKAVTFDI